MVYENCKVQIKNEDYLIEEHYISKWRWLFNPNFRKCLVDKDEKCKDVLITFDKQSEAKKELTNHENYKS
jgi:hypothetical protein